MKKLLSLLVALALLCALAPAAFAAGSEAVEAADELYALGLFEGTGTDESGAPIYSLDRAPTRHEAVTMLVRLLGKEAEAEAGTWTTPFTDLAAWAEPYVGYAYANGLTDGTGDTSFSGERKVTATQYLTLVLRALGYDDGAGDFAWDRAWEKTDALGLTDGAYTAANNADFLRGDVAIVSRDALGVKVKDGSQTLLERITQKSSHTRADYLARALSDAQLAALAGAELETLRAELSTLGDVIAYLDSMNCLMWTSVRGGLALDAAQALDDMRAGNTGTELYTCLAAYLLADDYEGMGYVLAAAQESLEPWLLSALYLPVRDGYLILTPAALSAIRDNNNCKLAGLEETTVPGLTEFGARLRPLQVAAGALVEQVFLAPADQEQILFARDGDGFSLQSGEARLIYRMSDADRQAAEEVLRQERASDAWEALDRNWDSFGMPAALAPTMSRAEAERLYGADLDTVAAAVKTLGDCIYYYAGAGFQALGGDLAIPAAGTLEWHFNYAPGAVLAHNYGCCGSISGLTAYLLRGDYDVTGIIGMTFLWGEGGGHVINYLKNGEEYYVFDMINLISCGYEQVGFLFTKAPSLEQAAATWRDASPWTEKVMYAYQSFDGDAPVGWDAAHRTVSYLPTEYRPTAVILLESPDEGYVYEWVDVSADIWARINAVRTES